MLGVIIQNQRQYIYLYLSGFLCLLSLFCLIWIGIPFVVGFSAAGIFFAGVGCIFSKFHPDKFPGIWIHFWAGFFNGSVLVTGWILTLLFLNPLPQEVLKIPKLNQIYSDPGGAFELRGPRGWDYQAVSAPDQYGVIISPQDRSQYMGINEIRIVVLKLPNKPENPEEFLLKFQESLSNPGRNQSRKKMFRLKSEPARLLLGGQGVWSEIEVRPQEAFSWICLTQTALIGIKQGDWVCSVSAAGPRPNSSLFRVMCLGLFEKLTIKSLQNNSH
ncbi:MAG: hypothetical protein LHV69_09150 [Elusimicrobia bacterium]|nr:hypothetical protein [Candidatus Obscuribacterium magneticum]